jgi:hypothetical protein
MRTRPERDPQHMAQSVYSTPCGCGRSRIHETDRPLSVRLCEHGHNLKEGLLKESKLAQHAYEGHRSLEIVHNSRHRKYKDSANMACLKHPISQPSLDISAIRIHLIIDEVTNSKGKP